MDTKRWKVYMHVNRLNGKRYIGITSKSNPNHRWNSGRGYKENPHFNSAIEKYGWDGFDHIIISDGLDAEEAKSMECSLISKWNTKNPLYGYNMTSGGDGTRGFYPSEDTRKKLSDARRKENLSEETLQRRSMSLRGRKFTNEHKWKIGDGNSKAVEMCDKNGNVLEHFKSARDAELKYGISHSHISQCCHDSRQSAGGYIWKFTQSF